jgi:RNA polymerase sigma-70 factor (ECF subfamily)
MLAQRDPLSEAIESVMTRFGGVVRTIAARYRLSPADRDELVQAVRVRLWQALDAERITTVHASYLYRAATSAAIDLVRRRRARREEPLDDLEAGGSQVADGATRPDEGAQLSDLAQQLERAIAAIPESRRAVVRMYLKGYGSGEIAEFMGWTEPKARNLLYRGLADLRTRLADAGITMEEQ